MANPLNVYQAAAYLGISHWQIYRYIKSGALKAYKLGAGKPELGSHRRWMIKQSDLDDFAFKHANVATTKVTRKGQNDV
jgi:excisionase family DNA binding protein